MPTHFGPIDYEIVSEIDRGKITATIRVPVRRKAGEILLRLRPPGTQRIGQVVINGQRWNDFDASRECVRLHDLTGTVQVEVEYPK